MNNRRKAFELREQGLSSKEIAATLNRALKTVQEYFYDPDRKKALARERRLATGERLLRSWTNQQIIDAFQQFVAEHDRTPARWEWKSPRRGDGYPSASTVERHFGDWNSAVKAAGLEARAVHQRRSKPTEELIAEIRDASIWGVAPATKHGRMHTVANLLASRGIYWTEACHLAGVRPRGRAKR